MLLNFRRDSDDLDLHSNRHLDFMANATCGGMVTLGMDLGIANANSDILKSTWERVESLKPT